MIWMGAVFGWVSVYNVAAGRRCKFAASSTEGMSMEAFAAVQAVWPALGPSVGKRLE